MSKINWFYDIMYELKKLKSLDGTTVIFIILLFNNPIKITLDFWKNAYKYKEHNWWTAHRAKLEAERIAKEEEERKAREEELAA